MRFLLNFIFFGLLFYGIFLFFPDAFKWLTSWAQSFYSLFQGVFHQIAATREVT
jgi:hypothetical protein